MDDEEKFKELVRIAAEEKLKVMLEPDERFKIHGPYLRKDGRKHAVMILKDEEGEIIERRTISWPKLKVLLLSEGRVAFSQTIDHHDRDFTNDDIFNLRALPLDEHARLDVERARYPTAPCVQCGEVFQLTRHQVGARASTVAGPFCSRRCRGLYGQEISSGSAPIERKPTPPVTYYRRDKGD